MKPLQRDSYLKRTYGLSEEDYTTLFIDQGGVCFICGSPPKTRSLHVDHVHVKGFKKLPPEKKRTYVRGLLCFQCNKFIVGRVNYEKAQRLIKYLQRFMFNQVWMNKANTENTASK